MSSKRAWRQTIGLALLAASMIGCGGVSAEPTATVKPLPPTSTPVPPTPTVTPVPATSTPVPPTPNPGFEEQVDVGGHELYIRCAGDGSPTVILDSEVNNIGRVWIPVWREVATFTRACYYDRAGLGRSDPPSVTPRTNQEMVDDLHTLLINASIEGPYVLVAHGMAGLVARLYTGQYPNQVGGVVLVDSAHPDQIARYLALLPPESPDESYGLNSFRRSITGSNPLGNPDHPGYDHEPWDAAASAAQVRSVGSLGDIVLAVLTRDHYKWWVWGQDFPPELAEHLEQEWLQMQKELAELSSNSTHVIVKDADHWIQEDQPAAVTDAVRRIVESVRGD